ncbi:MAG: SIMPL domain-containing protein [Pseudomonadota bacterium]
MRILPFLVLPFMVMACGEADAQSSASPAEAPRTLSVSGQGQAFGTPDMAMMQFGVVAQGRTAGEAMAANAEAMTAVRNRLRELGIAARDMQTANFSLSPVYERYDRNSSNQEQRKIVGYNVNNTLSVRLRDIEKVGDTIDAAVASGANNLNGLSFGFQDQSDLEDEAKRAAVKEARATAELLAEEAGVQLGRVMTLSVSSYNPRPQPVAMARMEAADMATPIEAGESSLSANVSMTFEIE